MPKKKKQKTQLSKSYGYREQKVALIQRETALCVYVCASLCVCVAGAGKCIKSLESGARPP